MIRLFLLLSWMITAALSAVASPTHGTVSRDAIRRIVVEEALGNPLVPPALALAVAEAESDFAADAESSAGARGVMQIMPATGRGEFGVEPDALWDPRLNVRLGVRFLGDLIERYDGRWDLALSHYNGGSAVGRGAAARVIPATRSYVDKVLTAERRWARDRTTQALIRMAAHTEPRAAYPRTADRRPDRLAQEADIARRLAVTGDDPAARRRRLMILADRALDLAADGHARAGQPRSSSALLGRIAERRGRFRDLLRMPGTGARTRNLL
ncbi:MAG: lytic transglycosylase domain-containing protein [Alphaproteobacteria bacterium]|nr:lytic transglycosylase domain-containing protein [Alphaproteobacteria bacterium]